MIFSGRQWGCLFVGNTDLRGKHLFEGPRRLFHFLVFQPQDSILSLFHTDKKNEAMKLQHIFQDKYSSVL